MKKIYAFDFDGTLTTRDSFLEFIRYVCGNWAFCKGILRYSPLLVLMKLGYYPNWKAKQKCLPHSPHTSVTIGKWVDELKLIMEYARTDQRMHFRLLHPVQQICHQKRDALGRWCHVDTFLTIKHTNTSLTIATVFFH